MNDLTIQNNTLSPPGASLPTQQTPLSGSDSFGQVLKGSLDRVNRLQTEADASISDLATGKQTDIHQTMIAVEKADVSFELLMQIRNKLIAAYETIMRMPVYASFGVRVASCGFYWNIEWRMRNIELRNSTRREPLGRMIDFNTLSIDGAKRLR